MSLRLTVSSVDMAFNEEQLQFLEAGGVSSALDLRLSVTSEEAPNFSKEAFLLVFSPLELTFPPGRDDVPSQGGEDDTSCCFRYLPCPGWTVSTRLSLFTYYWPAVL